MAGPRPLRPEQGARGGGPLCRARRARLLPGRWLDDVLSGRLAAWPATSPTTACRASRCRPARSGHGLSIACGMALAARRDGRPYRVFALLSDGECDEGSTWEAALFAAHHRLDNLVAIVDYNKIQSFGTRRGGARPRAVRRQVARLRLGGPRDRRPRPRRDPRRAVARCPSTPGGPTCVIAHTVKGKGVALHGKPAALALPVAGRGRARARAGRAGATL